MYVWTFVRLFVSCHVLRVVCCVLCVALSCVLLCVACRTVLHVVFHTLSCVPHFVLCSALCFAVLCCTLLYFALSCLVLFCFVLFCFVLSRAPRFTLLLSCLVFCSAVGSFLRHVDLSRCIEAARPSCSCRFLVARRYVCSVLT